MWPGHVLARAPALEHPRRAREEPHLVDHRRDLVGRHQRLGLAGAAALGVDEPCGIVLDRIGDAQQRPSAIRRRGRRPALERGARRADRVVDVGRSRPHGCAVLRARCTGRRAASFRRSRASTALPLTKFETLSIWHLLEGEPSIRKWTAARAVRSLSKPRPTTIFAHEPLLDNVSLAHHPRAPDRRAASVHDDRQDRRAVRSRGAPARATAARRGRDADRRGHRPACASGCTARR